MGQRTNRVKATQAAGLLMLAIGLPGIAVASVSGEIRANIIGGVEVPKGKFPFMASIQLDGRHFCGGSLLDERTIITAAHCVGFIRSTVMADRFSVTVGQTMLSDEIGSQRRKIDVVSISQVPGSDLALLSLDKPVTGVVPVALPTPGSDAFYQPGQLATVMGWGNTDADLPYAPDRLREVSVPIVSAAECAAAYPGSTHTYFCAGVRGKDSCQGDSGGPIVRAINGRVYQIGAVSFGKGCAEQGAPGAYVDLSSVDLWKSVTVTWNRAKES